MPVHQQIQQLVLDDKLEIMAGRIISIKEDANGIHVKARRRPAVTRRMIVPFKYQQPFGIERPARFYDRFQKTDVGQKYAAITQTIRTFPISFTNSLSENRMKLLLDIA